MSEEMSLNLGNFRKQMLSRCWSRSRWLPKSNGDVLVQRCVAGKIFMKIVFIRHWWQTDRHRLNHTLLTEVNIDRWSWRSSICAVADVMILPCCHWLSIASRTVYSCCARSQMQRLDVEPALASLDISTKLVEKLNLVSIWNVQRKCSVVVVVVVVLVVVVVVVVVVVEKVMFAHYYSKNSHERAKEESYALVKSSVLSRRRNAATDSWSPLSDAGSEFHVQLIVGISCWGWQRPADTCIVRKRICLLQVKYILIVVYLLCVQHSESDGVVFAMDCWVTTNQTRWIHSLLKCLHWLKINN